MKKIKPKSKSEFYNVISHQSEAFVCVCVGGGGGGLYMISLIV